MSTVNIASAVGHILISNQQVLPVLIPSDTPSGVGRYM